MSAKPEFNGLRNRFNHYVHALEAMAGGVEDIVSMLETERDEKAVALALKVLRARIDDVKAAREA